MWTPAAATAPATLGGVPQNPGGQANLVSGLDHVFTFDVRAADAGKRYEFFVISEQDYAMDPATAMAHFNLGHGYHMRAPVPYNGNVHKAFVVCFPHAWIGLQVRVGIVETANANVNSIGYGGEVLYTIT